MPDRNAKEIPLVSVLMTSFNREQFIGYAIESVLASSYTNFELIIVDDASVDATLSIARSYAVKDKRVQVYVNDYNQGDYPNRNKAASYARGKYIKYVDSDDYLYPLGLETMVSTMESFTNAGFGLCSLPAFADAPFPFMLQPKEAYRYHFFGPGLFHRGPVTAIFRTDAFRQAGGFKEQRMISDIDMWHRMGLHYPVVLMADGIVWVRKHADQELQHEAHYTQEYEKIKWTYLLDNACKLGTDELKQIRKKRLKRYKEFILSGIRNGNFQQVKDYFRCLQLVRRIKI